MTPVTDPALLAKLNGTAPAGPASAPTPAGPVFGQDRVRRAYQDAADWRKKSEAEQAEAGGLLANIGAGMDTTYRGIKDLFGQGDPDDVVEERRAVKDKLADTLPLGLGTVSQLGGQLAAEAPITMAGGQLLAKGGGKMFPKVAQAMRGKGVRAANLATAARAGVEGGLSGAISETTEDESRALNGVLGSFLGAGTGVTMATAGRTYKALSDKYGPQRAAKIFERLIGKEGMTQIDDALIDPANKPMLPLSTAAKSQSTKLAALERGARGRSDWGFDHDKKVSEEAWKRLNQATGQADELDVRIKDREDMMQASKEWLRDNTTKTGLKKAGKDLSDVVQSLRDSPVGRQNPEVTNLIGQVEEMLKHPDATAGDYSSQYWRLSKKLEENLSNEAADAIRTLRDAVQSGADTASKGGSSFSDFLGRYKAEQAHVDDAAAAKGIREQFKTPQGVVKSERTWGGTPEVTSPVLRRTLAKQGENAYGDVLESGSRQQIEGLESELGRHELWKSSNSPGSSSLEMDNPLSVVSSGRDNPFNYLPLVKGGANWLMHGSRKATTEAADKAMQDPAEWQKMVEALRKSKAPITPDEYADRLRRLLMNAPGRVAAGAVGE